MSMFCWGLPHFLKAPGDFFVPPRQFVFLLEWFVGFVCVLESAINLNPKHGIKKFLRPHKVSHSPLLHTILHVDKPINRDQISRNTYMCYLHDNTLKYVFHSFKCIVPNVFKKQTCVFIHSNGAFHVDTCWHNLLHFPVKQWDEFSLQRNNQNFLDSGLWFLGILSISNVQICDDANERHSDEWVEALDWIILHLEHWAPAVCCALLGMINDVQHTS